MISLKDAHQQFVGHLKGRNRAAATILAYGKDIEQLITFLVSNGREMSEDVQTEDLKMFMDKLNKENYTPKSVSRKTNSTKTFFKFLRTSNLRPDDPARSLEHPKFENSQLREFPQFQTFQRPWDLQS